MIQAVIARLGNDSFLVKGWAVTVTGVFLGFAVSSEDEWLAVVGTVPTLFFWLLDGYYLKSERLFRILYERVRSGASDVVPFGMDATSRAFAATLITEDERSTRSLRKTLWRPTIRYLYLGLALSAGIVAIVLSANDDGSSSHRTGCPHAGSKLAQHC
jgi:uncharacterized membrane protein